MDKILWSWFLEPISRLIPSICSLRYTQGRQDRRADATFPNLGRKTSKGWKKAEPSRQIFSNHWKHRIGARRPPPSLKLRRDTVGEASPTFPPMHYCPHSFSLLPPCKPLQLKRSVGRIRGTHLLHGWGKRTSEKSPFSSPTQRCGGEWIDGKVEDRGQRSEIRNCGARKGERVSCEYSEC